MKILSLLAFVFILASCKKETTVNQATPAGTVLKSGSFVTNAKPTSGTVKLIAGDNGARTLAFENLSTGSGPDVRVWVASNTTATGYQEIGTLRATSGSFNYVLPANIDLNTNNKVLIWCEDFALLFGHATLQ
jgi:hypothetical protein